MFSSPAIHVFSQENTKSVAKKPGTATLTRRPFVERAVNASPDVRKTLKPEPRSKKPELKFEKTLLSPKPKTEDDDMFFYDTFSFKDYEDKYFDIKRLSPKDTFNILRSYCNYGNSETPPPKLSNDIDMFMEIPKTDYFFAETFGDKMLEEDDDISLPSIDFD